jgi:hypothetical protein
MLQTAFNVLVALAIAIAGGAGTVLYALDRSQSLGAVPVGPWVAYPDSGTPDADPYTKARLARSGELALAKAEGLVFTARTDSDGQNLSGRCAYEISGKLPPARLWTIRAEPVDGAVATPVGRRKLALHSLHLLRNPDRTATVSVGATPMPGNWLALRIDGGFALVMTLYDAPLAYDGEVSGLEMPRIDRGACDG